MSYTEWLRGQVSRIEEVIQRHPVFDASEPSTTVQLAELRGIVVIHTYLKQQLLRQQLLRRETVVNAVEEYEKEYDTQELVLVRNSLAHANGSL